MKTLFVAIAVTAAVIAIPAVAQEEDAEGCKDSSVLTRMAGCRITECDTREFDRFDFKTGFDADQNDYKLQAVEGSKEARTYECAATTSVLQVQRNAATALKRAGFTAVYSGEGSSGDPMITARKGGLWIEVSTYVSGEVAYYTQTIVRSKEMTQSMEADASALEDQINATGRAAIYGILFETGKATIQPSSAATLGEVVKLLQKNAAWNIEIGGHTDNVGAKQANAQLSQARADAVKAWLVSHGVAAARLTTKGFGDSKPVAENTAEEGRAKNRRVELVKL